MHTPPRTYECCLQAPQSCHAVDAAAYVQRGGTVYVANPHGVPHASPADAEPLPAAVLSAVKHDGLY